MRRRSPGGCSPPEDRRGAYPARQGLRKPHPPTLRHLWTTTPSTLDHMPNVPASPCREHNTGCPNLRPCPTHPEPTPWAGARDQRRQRTGLSGSAEQRRNRRIMRHHHGVCHWCEQPGADQIDHVTPLAEGGTDEDDNLRPIHSAPCHVDKTNAERERGRRRARGELPPVGGGVAPRAVPAPGSRGAAIAHARKFPTRKPRARRGSF